MAEREGFEPSVQLPVHTLSRRAPSTARTSLQVVYFCKTFYLSGCKKYNIILQEYCQQEYMRITQDICWEYLLTL